jgi:hypothetical protein
MRGRLRNDGGKKARSPGRSRIICNTIAWGMPGDSGASAVNTGAHTSLPQRAPGCGCIGHPAFPAPSVCKGRRISGKARAHRRRGAKTCVRGVWDLNGKRSGFLSLPGRAKASDGWGWIDETNAMWRALKHPPPGALRHPPRRSRYARGGIASPWRRELGKLIPL